MMISCGILTGGKSSRMGTNKAFLTLQNVTFLDTLIKEFSVVGPLMLSVAQKDTYPSVSIPMYQDIHLGIGPIEGLRQLLKNSPTTHLFVCAVDMPFLKKELVLYLRDYICSDYDCYIIRHQGRIHPLCGIYTKAVLPSIEAQIEQGNYRMMDLLSQLRVKYIDIEKSCYAPDMLTNINTKEAYQQLLQPLIFCISGVKNSGKTTLIKRLISAFLPQYPNIAVIKHDGHEFEIDHPGTDSWTVKQAGAKKTLIYSNTQYALQCQHHQTPPDIQTLLPLVADMDIVILEGLKGSTFPKVELVRKEISHTCVCDPATLLAVVSDTIPDNLPDAVPLIRFDDINAIANLIQEQYLNKKKG